MQRLDKNHELVFALIKEQWDNQNNSSENASRTGSNSQPEPALFVLFVCVFCLLVCLAAVKKHDVNNLSRDNNENATARQKP